ncbi:hypothetical protein D3C75_1121060 [compost metagenome]
MRHPGALGTDLRLQPLRGTNKRLHQLDPDLPLHRLQGRHRLTVMLIGGEAKTKAKLGVVLEQ